MGGIGGLHVSDFEAVAAYAQEIIQQGGGVFAEVYWREPDHGDWPYEIGVSGTLHRLGGGQLGVEGNLTHVSGRERLMGEEDNKGYDRCNHGYRANPETADTKPAILNDHP